MDVGDSKPKEDTTEEPHEFMFDDLPIQLTERGVYSHTPAYESTVREIGPHFDVSRPQPQLDPKAYGNRILPATILYDAWRRQNEGQFTFSSDEEDEEEGQGSAQAEDIIPAWYL